MSKQPTIDELIEDDEDYLIELSNGSYTSKSTVDFLTQCLIEEITASRND